MLSDKHLQRWPRCSFFGIFDGNGGLSCAEFLRDKLHKYITQDECFPAEPKKCIVNALQKADEDFLKNAYDSETKTLFDNTGSSVILALTVDNMCYIANVGDSRAILSTKDGSDIYQLSRDHKLNIGME